MFKEDNKEPKRDGNCNRKIDEAFAAFTSLRAKPHYYAFPKLCGLWLRLPHKRGWLAPAPLRRARERDHIPKITHRRPSSARHPAAPCVCVAAMKIQTSPAAIPSSCKCPSSRIAMFAIGSSFSKPGPCEKPGSVRQRQEPQRC